MMNHVATFTRAAECGTVRRIAGYTYLRVRSREHRADVTILIDRARTTDRVAGLTVTQHGRPVPGIHLSSATRADRASAQAIYRWALSRLAMGPRALALLDEDRRLLDAHWAQREVAA